MVEFQEDYEKTIVWNGPLQNTDSEEEIYEEPEEEEEEKPIVRNKRTQIRKTGSGNLCSCG